MRAWILLLVLGWLGACAAYGDPPEMATRIYPVLPSLADPEFHGMRRSDSEFGKGMAGTSGGHGQPGGIRDWKALFERYGVAFPTGATIHFNPAISSLTVRSTPAQLDIFERILAVINVVPSQIEIDLSYVTFDAGLVREMVRRSDAAAPVGHDLVVLWRQGTGRLIHSSKHITASGIALHVEGPAEIVRPVDGDKDVHRGTLKPRNPGRESAPSSETEPAAWVTPIVGPDGYTVYLQFDPGPDDPQITAASASETTGPSGMKSAIRATTPDVHSIRLPASVLLWDGQTMVAGGTLSEDGKDSAYLFLTVHLIDPAGIRVHGPKSVPATGLEPAEARSGRP